MAILHFDLPEDCDSYYNASNADTIVNTIGEFSQKLRSMYKYEDIGSADVYDIRQLLFDTFIENGLNTDML